MNVLRMPITLKRSRLFVSGAWLVQLAAWFLPAVTRIAGGSIDPIRGWHSFLISCRARWHGDSPWYRVALAILSVITTLLFIIGSPAVVLRGTRSVQRSSAWMGVVAFFLNAHWLLQTDGWTIGLGVGYFLW